MKRVILNLTDEVAKKIDDEVKRLALPSRNAYAEQVFRKELGLPNVFEEAE